MAKKNLNNPHMGSSDEDINTNHYPEEYMTNENPYLSSFGAYTPNSYMNENLSYNIPNYIAEQQYNPPTNYQAYYEPEFRNNFYEDSKLHTQRQVDLKFIEGRTRRSVTFSKRKKGLMKKAFELSVLTGSEVLVLVSSEGGHVFSFATDKLKRLISEQEDLIKKYLDEPIIKNEQRKDKKF